MYWKVCQLLLITSFLVASDAKSSRQKLNHAHLHYLQHRLLSYCRKYFQNTDSQKIWSLTTLQFLTVNLTEEFQNFCSKADIFCKFIASEQTATNRLTEKNVQTLKKTSATMIDEPVSMHKKFRKILFRYIVTPWNNIRTPAEQYLK